MASQDGRKWEELPDSVREAYVEKAIERAENQLTEHKMRKERKDGIR